MSFKLQQNSLRKQVRPASALARTRSVVPAGTRQRSVDDLSCLGTARTQALASGDGLLRHCLVVVSSVQCHRSLCSYEPRPALALAQTLRPLAGRGSVNRPAREVRHRGAAPALPTLLPPARHGSDQRGLRLRLAINGHRWYPR